jgi:hypothetical protein
MNHVKVFCVCGNYWETGFNGTQAEAEAYFVGQRFNIGVEEDQMVMVERIEFIPAS